MLGILLIITDRAHKRTKNVQSLMVCFLKGDNEQMNKKKSISDK